MGLCAMAWWSPECHLPAMAALHVAVSLLLCVTCGCPWGGGPVQARAGAHHPHLALGSGPSGRRSCLGLGPQPEPPFSSPGVWSRLHVGPRRAWQEPSAQARHGRAGCEDGRRLPVITPTVLLPAEAEGSQMAWRVCLGGSKPPSVRLLGY